LGYFRSLATERTNIEELINRLSNYIVRLRVLALFMIFICLGLSKGIGNISAGTLLVLSLLTLNISILKQNLLHFKHVWALGLMFLMLVVGMLYSSDLTSGVEVLKQFSRFVFIPLLLLLNVDIVRNYYKQLLFAFVISTAFGGMFTITLNYLDEPTVIKITELTPFLQKYIKHHSRAMFGAYSPFYDRIQYANIIGMAVLSGLYLLVKNYRRTLVFLCVATLLYTSILLGGRGGQLALLGALFVYISMIIYHEWSAPLIKKIGKPLTLAIISSSVVFVFLITPFLVYKYNDNVRKRYNLMKWELETFYSGAPKNEAFMHFTSVRRLVSWQNTWEIIRENPIFGVGTGDYKNALKTVYEADGYEFPENSHSQYLYFWAMAGIIGLSLFIGIIIYWINHLKTCSKEFMYGISFVAFYAITMLPDAVLIQQMDNLSFSLFFSYIGIIGSFYNLKND